MAKGRSFKIMTGHVFLQLVASSFGFRGSYMKKPHQHSLTCHDRFLVARTGSRICRKQHNKVAVAPAPHFRAFRFWSCRILEVAMPKVHKLFLLEAGVDFFLVAGGTFLSRPVHSVPAITAHGLSVLVSAMRESRTGCSHRCTVGMSQARRRLCRHRGWDQDRHLQCLAWVQQCLSVHQVLRSCRQ